MSGRGELTITIPIGLPDVKRQQLEVLVEEIFQRVAQLRALADRLGVAFHDADARGGPPVHVRIDIGGHGP